MFLNLHKNLYRLMFPFSMMYTFEHIVWYDSIHIDLRRNDGFLHLFRDFTESNAFSENLIRMKFILHKIYFRMGILSSSKTSWMFFNLISKMILLVQLNYYCHDTSHNFEPIFLKFAQVNPIVFGNNQPNRITGMGENVPQNWFFGFHSAGMDFFEEKILELYVVPYLL